MQGLFSDRGMMLGCKNKLSQCLAVGGCHPPFGKYLLKFFLKPLSSFAGGNFGEGCVFVFQRNALPLIGFLFDASEAFVR
jgi:hypothetical protein